jgi:hypothetical protein
MRTLSIITALTLAISTAAAAQDMPRETPAPPPPPMQAETHVAAPGVVDYLKEAPDQNARERGRGAMLITLGSVLLPIGAAMAGTSALLWDGYSSSCSYKCDASDRAFAGGLSLSLIGALVVGGSITMLAIGTQKYVEHKKPFGWMSPSGGVRF